MKAAGQDTMESAAKIKSWQETEKEFVKQTGLKKQGDRSRIGGFGKNDARNTTRDAERYYKHWVSRITQAGAPKKLAEYYDMKYNNPKEYKLLKSYAQAVEIGDISPLIGFDVYKSTAAQIQKELVGLTAINGSKIKGCVGHFVDRVIGQTSEIHTGKRTGVPVDDVKDALKSGSIVKETTRKDGKRSIEIAGQKCSVSFNPNTGFLIQTNPRRGKV